VQALASGDPGELSLRTDVGKYGDPDINSFLAMSNRFGLPTALTAEILGEARRDYLGLWWIVRKVREQLPSLSASERRIATLEFLRPMLESGDLVAGKPGREAQTFSQWEGKASEMLARIEESWPAGAADPDIGGDIWFTSPT